MNCVDGRRRHCIVRITIAFARDDRLGAAAAYSAEAGSCSLQLLASAATCHGVVVYVGCVDKAVLRKLSGVRTRLTSSCPFSV